MEHKPKHIVYKKFTRSNKINLNINENPLSHAGCLTESQ